MGTAWGRLGPVQVGLVLAAIGAAAVLGTRQGDGWVPAVLAVLGTATARAGAGGSPRLAAGPRERLRVVREGGEATPSILWIERETAAGRSLVRVRFDHDLITVDTDLPGVPPSRTLEPGSDPERAAIQLRLAATKRDPVSRPVRYAAAALLERLVVAGVADPAADAPLDPPTNAD